jgi:hypothetical protein
MTARSRLTMVASSIVLATTLSAGLAWAGPSFESEGTNEGSRATVVAPGQSGPIADSVSAPNDGMVWVGIPWLAAMEGEGGEVVYCSRTRWVRVAPEEREERTAHGRSSYLHLFDSVPELEGHDAHLECPVDPTEAIPPAVLRDAVQHTIRDNLPRPDLSVPPGYALTGMPAFLVTNHQLEYGPVSHTVDLGALVLQVTVEATGTTQVDWGDGTVATYRSPGTPWPDGQVVHTYSDTGHVTITVTDTWQVTYRVPALGIVDTVEAPLPPRTLEDLPIQQVQSVRIRSDR